MQQALGFLCNLLNILCGDDFAADLMTFVSQPLAVWVAADHAGCVGQEV